MVAVFTEYGRVIIEIVVFALVMILFSLAIKTVRNYSKSFIAIVTGVPRDMMEVVVKGETTPKEGAEE